MPVGVRDAAEHEAGLRRPRRRRARRAMRAALGRWRDDVVQKRHHGRGLVGSSGSSVTVTCVTRPIAPSVASPWCGTRESPARGRGSCARRCRSASRHRRARGSRRHHRIPASGRAAAVVTVTSRCAACRSSLRRRGRRQLAPILVRSVSAISRIDLPRSVTLPSCESQSARLNSVPSCDSSCWLCSNAAHASAYCFFAISSRPCLNVRSATPRDRDQDAQAAHARLA